jgi:hypothetical protein
LEEGLKMDGPFFVFRERVCQYLKIAPDSPSAAAFCWEVLFDIVEGTDDYEFDFPHLRTTSDFLIAAVLLSVFHQKRVAVIEPTAYYSAQAVRMFRRWILDAPNISIGNVGAIPLDNVDVIFNHGKRFIGKDGKRRIITQIFPGEDVPSDPRSLRSLTAPSYYY